MEPKSNYHDEINALRAGMNADQEESAEREDSVSQKAPAEHRQGRGWWRNFWRGEDAPAATPEPASSQTQPVEKSRLRVHQESIAAPAVDADDELPSIDAVTGIEQPTPTVSDELPDPEIEDIVQSVQPEDVQTAEPQDEASEENVVLSLTDLDRLAERTATARAEKRVYTERELADLRTEKQYEAVTHAVEKTLHGINLGWVKLRTFTIPGRLIAQVKEVAIASGIVGGTAVLANAVNPDLVAPALATLAGIQTARSYGPEVVRKVGKNIIAPLAEIPAKTERAVVNIATRMVARANVAVAQTERQAAENKTAVTETFSKPYEKRRTKIQEDNERLRKELLARKQQIESRLSSADNMTRLRLLKRLAEIDTRLVQLPDAGVSGADIARDMATEQIRDIQNAVLDEEVTEDEIMEIIDRNEAQSIPEWQSRLQTTQETFSRLVREGKMDWDTRFIGAFLLGLVEEKTVTSLQEMEDIETALLFIQKNMVELSKKIAKSAGDIVANVPGAREQYRENERRMESLINPNKSNILEIVLNDEDLMRKARRMKGTSTR